MAATLCVHCLAVEGSTRDHGIPSSWYPSGSAPVARMVAPSCAACNARLSRVEEEIRQILAMCLDPGDPRAAGIVSSALRALDPTAAKNGRDRERRAAVRARIQNLVFTPTSVRGALPGFGPEGRSPLALKLPATAFKTFGEKVIRVATWAAFQSHIGRDIAIETHVGEPNDDVAAMIARFGHRFDVPPAVHVAIVRPPDELRAALLVLDLCGRLRLFVSALPVAMVEEMRAERAASGAH